MMKQGLKRMSVTIFIPVIIALTFIYTGSSKGQCEVHV